MSDCLADASVCTEGLRGNSMKICSSKTLPLYHIDITFISFVEKDETLTKYIFSLVTKVTSANLEYILGW